MISAASAMLVCVTVAFGCLAYGVLRFPDSIAGGWSPFIIAATGLVTYAAVSMWLLRGAARRFQVAFRGATTIGLGLAAVAVVNHSLELWAPVSAALGAALGAGMWGLMFLAFGIACSTTLAKQQPVAVGIAASA